MRKNMKSRAPAGKAKRAASGSRKASTRAAKTAKPRRQTRAQAEKVLRRGPIRKRQAPEQPGLPEMENMGADKKMDDICRRVANRHAEMNDLRRDDQADYQLALTRLRKIDRMSYNRFGVEMVRVPGEEKLRVRTSGREEASSEVDEPAAEPEPDNPDVEAMDVEADLDDEGADAEQLH